MELSTLIGSIAATLTTASFLPQAIKVVKTRDTQSISLWMYLMFSIGVLLWFIYGVMVVSIPIITANAVTLCFSSIILYFKLVEKKN